MAKDLKNVVVILDGNMAKASEALDKGQTVEIAVEKGEKVKESLATGFMKFLNANLELASSTAPANSVCGCGKPADIMVRIWR